MSSRNLSRIAVVLFLAVGLLSLLTRRHYRQQEQFARDSSLWRLSYQVSFESADGEALLHINLPLQSEKATILDEELTYQGLKAETDTTATRRVLQVSSRHPGKHSVAAEFDIRLEPKQDWTSAGQWEQLSADARNRFLRASATIPVQSPNVQKVLLMARNEATTASELLKWIFEYVSRDLRPGSGADGGDDVAMSLATGTTSQLGRSRTMVALCRAARIPARLVAGFEMRQSLSPRPHVWVEVFRGHNWIPFDPEYGFARSMPATFVACNHDGEQLLRSEGAKNVSANYAITRLPFSEVALDSDVRHPSQIFDLTRLPLEMHEVMSLMLLLPLGALITAVFRNLIGITTFGTFAPALLAMSFIYAAWGTGIVILTVVATGGLFGRILLDKLHLLMLPRLSVILTTIIMCVIFGVSLLDYVEITPSAQAVLLPLVIMTTMIERLYVSAEEDGVGFTIQLAFNTFLVAICCYLVLRWEEIGRLILIYPEIHFLTIAGFILIGRYTGYRLTELWRFRDLIRPEERF